MVSDEEVEDEDDVGGGEDSAGVVINLLDIVESVATILLCTSLALQNILSKSGMDNIDSGSNLKLGTNILQTDLDILEIGNSFTATYSLKETSKRAYFLY